MCNLSCAADNRRGACCTPLPVPPPQGGRERCGTALPICTNAECRSARLHIFNCQTALRDVAFRQTISTPFLLLGAGVRPTSAFFRLPRIEGGRRADKA